MLIKAKTLNGYKLASLDGEIGKVNDLYFDDRHWTIRYLVAETGSWLATRKVLISPYALNGVIQSGKEISVNLSKLQIEKSPSIDTDKPVSRQFEDDYYVYYGWPTYWGGSSAWGDVAYIERDRNKWAQFNKGAKTWDSHLRSISKVSGYHLHASDGDIGHVEDFIIDDENWTIRYLVVATTNWWPGKKVLLSPLWFERVSWEESKIFTSLPRKTIQDSPEYTAESLITRNFEIGMHHHYDRQGYWIPAVKAA